MTANVQKIAQDLWKSADQLRANSALKSNEYASPVLGLIFLRYADYRFKKVQAEASGRRVRGKKAQESLKDFYKAKGAAILILKRVCVISAIARYVKNYQPLLGQGF